MVVQDLHVRDSTISNWVGVIRRSFGLSNNEQALSSSIVPVLFY